MSPTAVVLTSGGLDSTTCLAIALERGFRVVAVSFAYGQRHAVELRALAHVLRHYGITDHIELELGLFRQLGGNALTGDVAVPRSRALSEIAEGIPATFVPARNLVFLSLALGVAERFGADDLFIGVNALDYSGYPDCRPEFVQQFERTANLATRSIPGASPLRIHAPLVDLTKAQIVEWGLELGVPHQLTHSCYDPTEEGIACGRCDSCLLRLKGFEEAGVRDPIRYAPVGERAAALGA